MESSSTAKPSLSIVARILAPLAIVAAVIVIALVVGGTLGSDDGGGERRGGERTEQPRRQAPEEETYVVQPNDTFSSIAAKTDVPVEDLQRLNPDIDPQALPSGATLKLR